MEIPINLIGGAGFFPARNFTDTSQYKESRESSYEEELNILGIEGKSSADLFNIIFAIELRWILNASIKWKSVGTAPNRKFLAMYQGVELFLYVNVCNDGALGKHTAIIKIGRIVRSVSKVSSIVLLVREISVRNNLVFRKNTHYTHRPRNN
ncbi:MAG: hypothetical protein HYT28_03615 [Parcubacteria group bacterium]|nr:hypothetical protein [Parcubacteria group bacterium]